MAAKKYIELSTGQLAEKQATIVSAGAGNEGDLVALDASGKLSLTVMPVGIGPDTAAITAVGAISAGDLVNVYDDSGPVCRKADASNARKAHGFCLDAFLDTETALVYFEGVITGLSGLTPGVPMYLGTVGAATDTPASTATHLSQEIGTAISATEISFEPQRAITLA